MQNPEPAGDVLLYEKRRGVYPKAVDGWYRRVKWGWMAICFAVYYITPWIRWDRGPYAPNQAVLIDLANRRFYMFSIEIWPQEFYFVAGLLIMAGIGLFVITSAFGRAWCGYSCPQTVWTDLFQHVDRLVDGDRNAQIRLKNAPWTAKKIGKRALKWSIYLVISSLTGGAWIAYFTDCPTLAREYNAGTAAPIAYYTVAVLTLTTFVLGGFMREQVCIYMCPWPRIQTAMLDEKSLSVTYKDWRGEPRGSVKQAKDAAEPLGDCIDCDQCVSVCPTGYDIRNGPDISCITCGLCIDACDSVMDKLDRPRGLIAYATLTGAEAERKHGQPENILRTVFRPRTIIYFGIWASIGMVLLFALGIRQRLDLTVTKDRNPPYMMMSNGSVRNAYTVKLRNMENRPRTIEIGLDGLPGAVMWSDDVPRSSAARTLRRTVAADQADPLRIYLIAPAGTEEEEFRFTLRAIDKEGGTASKETRFDSPGDDE